MEDKTTFVDYAGQRRKLASDTALHANFNEIPVINIGPFIAEGASEYDKAAVVRLVRDACENVGFLYIKGHGIPQQTADRVLAAASTFFDLGEQDKMEVYFKKSPVFRGFEPRQGTQHATGHLKEAFNYGYSPDIDPLNPSNDPQIEVDVSMAQGPNVWPSNPIAESVKKAVHAYFGQVLLLGRKMIQIFALALDLPESYFDEVFRIPGVLGRMLYYPPQPASDSESIGIAAHTDIECFTFLLQDPTVTCLQVLNKRGEWIHAPPIPGTLVLNVGDMLSRWSNNRFVSTVHRVINSQADVSRYSVPIFFGPAYDTVVSTLQTCVKDGECPSFEPIRAGEYVWRRLARSRLGTEYDEKEDIMSMIKAAAVETL